MERSVVTYENENGEVRGVYVSENGIVEGLLLDLRLRLAEHGFKALTEWVENGIEKGYYTYGSDEEPKTCEDKPGNLPINEYEYGYEATPTGIFLRHSKQHSNKMIDFVNDYFGDFDPEDYSIKGDELSAELLPEAFSEKMKKGFKSKQRAKQKRNKKS